VNLSGKPENIILSVYLYVCGYSVGAANKITKRSGRLRNKQKCEQISFYLHNRKTYSLSNKKLIVGPSDSDGKTGRARRNDDRCRRGQKTERRSIVQFVVAASSQPSRHES